MRNSPEFGDPLGEGEFRKGENGETRSCDCETKAMERVSKSQSWAKHRRIYRIDHWNGATLLKEKLGRF